MIFCLCRTLGERLDGISGEGAAQKLRGRVGTTVTVKVSSVNILLLFWPIYTSFYGSRISSLDIKLTINFFWTNVWKNAHLGCVKCAFRCKIVQLLKILNCWISKYHLVHFLYVLFNFLLNEEEKEEKLQQTETCWSLVYQFVLV